MAFHVMHPQASAVQPVRVLYATVPHNSRTLLKEGFIHGGRCGLGLDEHELLAGDETSMYWVVVDVEFGLHVAEHPIGEQLEDAAHVVHVDGRSPNDNVGPVVGCQCWGKIVLSDTVADFPALRAGLAASNIPHVIEVVGAYVCAICRSHFAKDVGNGCGAASLPGASIDDKYVHFVPPS